MWILCFLYSCFCALFVATFLANIRPDDAQKWLESLLTILLDDFLIQPMLVAIVYTLITAALVARSPSLVEEIRNDLQILDDAVTLVSAEPLSASVVAASWLLDLRTKRSCSVFSSVRIEAEPTFGTELCLIDLTSQCDTRELCDTGPSSPHQFAFAGRPSDGSSNLPRRNLPRCNAFDEVCLGVAEAICLDVADEVERSFELQHINIDNIMV